jgi:hypothetical protein
MSDTITVNERHAASCAAVRTALAIGVVMLALLPAQARAQDDPQRIGPYVVDLRGTLPMFGDSEQLAASRGLTQTELPGAGRGIDVGAHVFVFKWKAVTVGLGGQFTVGWSRFTPPEEDGGAAGRTVRERYTSISPQLSLNFGDRDGWSYLSGGLGRSQRSLVPDGSDPLPADEEGLRTFNYGGGARWFAKPRLAFTVDVRFHATDPGLPDGGRPGSPRSTFVVIGAGVSIR